MRTREMRRILRRCVQGETVLRICEKRADGKGTEVGYYALFSNYVPIMNSRYRKSDVPDWLYVETGKDQQSKQNRSRCTVLRDVNSIQIISEKEIDSLLISCERLIGLELKEAFKRTREDILVKLVGFLNELLGVFPQVNT